MKNMRSRIILALESDFVNLWPYETMFEKITMLGGYFEFYISCDAWDGTNYDIFNDATEICGLIIVEFQEWKKLSLR